MTFQQGQPFRKAAWFSGTMLLVAAAVTACSERRAPLPGGYFIFIASGSEIVLNEPKYRGSLPELGTDLQAIGHHHEFIFGRSGAARGSTPGYFLLNTQDGSITAGLTEANWLSLTSAAGIPNPPQLVNPARQPPVKR